MNLIEAKIESLIVESSKDGEMSFNNSRWRLVPRITDKILVATNEEYSTEETQNLIDLLERVRAESIVSPKNI